MKWNWLKRLFTFRFYITTCSINPALMSYDLFSVFIDISYLIYMNVAIMKDRNFRFIFDVLLFSKFYFVFDTARRETNYWLMKKKGY